MSAKDIFQRVEEVPVRAMAGLVRGRISDLLRKLNMTADTSQFPGKTVPSMFSKLYGPIGMQVARHVAGGTGYDNVALSTLVTPGTFITPRNGNILTGRDGAFYWRSSQAVGFLNWTYAVDPGFAANPTPVNAMPQGDIFSPAIENNGGAQVLMNFSGFAFPGKPKLCFEVDLYDRRRSRSLTDGRVPGECFAGGTHAMVGVGEDLRFDSDTEIEPRVYITEAVVARAPQFFNLDGDVAFSAARVTFWLSLLFKGYMMLEDQYNTAAEDAAATDAMRRKS